MERSERAELEVELERLLRTGDLDGAATRIVQGYGPELFGFLRAILQHPDAAADAFAELCEQMWKALPQFEQRASFRTWLYVLARHTAWHRLRQVARVRDHVPLDATSVLSRLHEQARTVTQAYLRSATRTRLDELRLALPPEEQALLILRVDKKLEWNELARVLTDGPLDEAALKREAARLRKRFQLVKERLRAQATREGLLGED